jgi:hypothetical protein
LPANLQEVSQKRVIRRFLGDGCDEVVKRPLMPDIGACPRCIDHRFSRRFHHVMSKALSEVGPVAVKVTA